MNESHSNEVLVFFVEDNPADISLMREALDKCSLKVNLVIANDGEEALYLLKGKDFRPDLVILDLHLPKLNGLDVLERYHPKAAPVVIFSSNCNDPDAERALRLGASGCVVKPPDLDRFMEVVCAMLERWTAPSVV